MVMRDGLLDDRVTELEDVVEKLESRPAGGGGAPDGALAVGAIGVAAAGLLLARRRRSATPPSPSHPGVADRETAQPAE